MKRFSLDRLKKLDYRKLKKSRIPAVLVLLGCFVIIAANSDFSRLAVPVAGGSVTERPTIVLDAGHGGEDGGCVGIGGEIEKDINLAIVLDLRDMLTLGGFNVVLTRDADRAIYDPGTETLREKKVSDMENRLKIITAQKDCVFLSVHQNQFTQPEYFGAQVFYNENNPDNRLLAQIMQENFQALQPENDRTTKVMDTELYLFKDTETPSVLIECGFLSNPDDAAKLSDPEYQRKVAFMIYNGVIRYMQTVAPAETSIIN
ncbi:MAG: N-acetylmuramoyl-L-alanine amidase [Eubacterium sp.]|nr:N-acetylmuramoyl-L-alanine amidase [Eubacterium sp.]